MKPICLPCRRFYRVKKNGVPFLEMRPTDGEAKALPGNAEPERWLPYKLWMGDRWECPDCGASIISGVGQQPMSEHYKPEFEAEVSAWNTEIKINDC